jgi:hypothetical protein
MVRRRRDEQIQADDLRAGYDPNGEDAERALPRGPRGRTGVLGSALPRPAADEVVCRSCRMLVRRPDLRGTGVILLVCDDCAR